MNWDRHTNLTGKHAVLSPSKSAWLRYDDDQLYAALEKSMATVRGTQLHELCAQAIKLGIKLQGRTTEARFVNDAIGFRMEPEQPLFYSEVCFGTADAISFRNNKLRIHDLKTGTTPAKMDQLLVYAGLFCLEYRFKPKDIQIELRIYQNGEVLAYEPTFDDIMHVMDRIVYATERLREMRALGDD